MNKNDFKKKVKIDDSDQILQDELIEDDQELEDLESENEKEDQISEDFKKLESQLKRAVADYQNLEKRTQEVKKELILSANKDLILRLLPGLDSLLLAELHTNDQGVKIAIKHFMDILEQEGVKKIKTEAAEFDPNLMEAVTTAEGDEGKVVKEVRAGYMLNENVLRAAQVIVGAENKSN